MEKRADIERLVQAANTPVDLLYVKKGQSLIHAEMERQASLPPPLHIRELTIDVVIMPHCKLVRFAIMDGAAIYMAPSTVLHMFDFADCIGHMHFWLTQNTHTVNEKFENFVRVLQRNDTTNVSDAVKAIRESSAFDSGSLVDCELLTCALIDVLYAACNK